jgi:tRNA/rRNA methyltransferase
MLCSARAKSQISGFPVPGTMPQVKVVLVGPRVDGNVGAVARSMANFGFSELCLVDPCPLTDEAFKRAKHANYILRGAQVVNSLEEAIADCFHVVGTSGIVTTGEKHYIRIPLTPKELAERLKGVEEKVAVVFGPEDTGLRQGDLARCDLLVSIPSHQDYPVLNLSHAVAVVLYELYQGSVHVPSPKKASERERDKLYEFFDDLLDAIGHPEFRRERTSIMFRRMMGRALPSRWEFHTIMGVFKDATKLIRGK